MKKINLLIAAGLMASASMQAQTVIAQLGFEDGDPTGMTSQYALTPGLSIFGDFVNVKNQAFMEKPANKVVSYEGTDEWNEKSTDEVHSGSFAFQAVNCSGWTYLNDQEEETAGVSQTWDRGFKIANLPVQQDKSYRVSFWIKGDEGAKCSSWLSQGIENFDKSACTASNYNYGINQAVLTGEWQFKSFVAFINSDRINQGMEAWTGNAKYPEEWGGDGSKTYRQFYEDKLPQEFFFIVNMFSQGATYLLDDIKIEEDVFINKVYFNYFDAESEANANVLKLDFGYQTNAKALAQSVGGIYVLDTEKDGVSVTVNGQPAEVFSMEAHEDGNVYIFLDEDELTYDGTAKIVVSYTPSANSPLLYEGQVRPSADYDTPLQVKGFANEVAWFDETIEETSSLWAAPTVVSTVPENGSFELESATLTNIAVKFDKDVDVSSASAALEYKGTTIPLDDVQVDATDPTVVNVPVSGLADGEYKFILANVESAIAGIPIQADVTVEFSVGEDTGSGSIEEIWTDNIASVGGDKMPAGWTGNGQATNGGIAEMSAGGAPRTMFDASAKNHGIYISGRDTQIGTLAYGKAAIDAINPSTGEMPEDAQNVALLLEAGKYNICYRMARWDQNNGAGGQTITLAVYNAEGVAALAPTELTVTDQVKNAWTGDASWVTDPTEDGLITKRSTEVTIPATGYYYIEFATNSAAMGVSYYLTALSIESKPSSIAAEQKAKLAAAVEKYKPTKEAAEDEAYDGETKTAFMDAYSNVEAGKFHTVSEVDAAIETLDAQATKMQARIDNIDNFGLSVLNAIAAYEGLEGEKYLNSDIAKEAKALLDQYAEVDPSALSDEDLAETTPKLKNIAAQMENVKSCVDILTWRAYKAFQTATNLGVTGAEKDKMLTISTDDTQAINVVNGLSKIALYEAIAANPNFVEANKSLAPVEEGQEAAALKTTVNYDNGQKVVEDDEVGYVDKTSEDVATTGIDFTSLIRNPQFYTQTIGSKPKLADNVVVGWMSNNEGNAHSNADPGASAANPVVKSAINAFGDAYTFYQEITDAPVGVYDIYFATRTAIKNNPMGDTGVKGVFNAKDDEREGATGLWDKYIFAQVDDEDPIVVPFAAGSSWFGHPTVIPGVQVKEGSKLTIGAVEKYLSGKASGHDWDAEAGAYKPTNNWDTNTFVGEARMFFVAPLEGYDYGKAAEEATSIKNIEGATASKKANATYNLAGQRVDASYKGIVIKNGKKVLNK